jgi:hypothetical protein
VAGAGTTDGLSLLNNLPDNTWIRLNQDGMIDPPRQTVHGSITVDTARNRVYLYGSDTHGESDNNSIWYFDLPTLTWNWVYADDATSTYIKDTGAPLADGDFWAKTTTGHPVPSHVFDAMRYIPGRNAILVLQWPTHNDTVKDILGSAGAYALWMFHTDTLQWQLVRQLMPYAGFTLGENDYPWYARLGTTPDGSNTVLSLTGKTLSFDWNTMTFNLYNTSGTPPVDNYHSGIEYDTYLQKFIVTGGPGESPVKTYAVDPATLTWSVLDTAGVPPLTGANIGYDTVNQVLIAHAVNGSNSFDNPSGAADTWVRVSATGVWTRMLSSAIGDTVPPHFGFGFRGEYDMKHNVFYFVGERAYENSPATDIWAYRYKGAGSNSDTTPPAVPGGVTAQALSSSRIDVGWSPSNDAESGVSSYNVYRNNSLIANTTATGYSDTGLAPDTTYSYQLSAINGEGLESTKSPVVSATTAVLPAPPPDPIFDDGFEEN